MCGEDRIDKIIMYSGLTIIAIIMIVMTIVICVMKYRKEQIQRGTEATQHYSDRSTYKEGMISPSNAKGRESEYKESRYSTYEALTGSGTLQKK